MQTQTKPQETPTILDDNPTNWLVQFPDGSTDIITKSSINRLLYEHNLWDLLRTGNDILVIDTDDGWVRLTPNDDSTEFTLEVGAGDPLHLGQHMKSDLINVLEKVFIDTTEKDPVPLIEFYEAVRSDRVRHDAMAAIGSQPPFSEAVTVRDDGWLIHDYLLLTWEQEFYHPNTTTRRISGGVVPAGSSEPAYQLSLSGSDGENRDVTIDGDSYRLTNAEMKFIAKGLWGVTEAPTPDALQRKTTAMQGTPGL